MLINWLMVGVGIAAADAIEAAQNTAKNDTERAKYQLLATAAEAEKHAAIATQNAEFTDAASAALLVELDVICDNIAKNRAKLRLKSIDDSRECF